MNQFMKLAADTSTASAGSWWSIILVYAVFIGALYLIFFRPQQKKKKKEEAMRKNLQIGDEIVTIGGIVGRVVAIKEDADSFVIETGTDRNKLLIKRWALGSVLTIHDNP